MTNSERFEDRLLAELRQIVADRPAPVAAAPRTPRRPAPVRALRGAPRRVRLGLTGVGAAAAIGAAAIIATGGNVAEPAYAVQTTAGGAVTVHVHSLNDAPGLQRELRAAGVPAVVTYDPDAARCTPAPDAGGPAGADGPTLQRHFESGTADDRPSTQQAGGAPAGGGPRVTTGVRVGSDGATFTIDPGNLKPNDKVYVSTSGGALASLSVAVGDHAPSAPCAG
jgi:hypothetical protein